MQSIPREERQIRAARNQSMFRSVNEKLRELNESMSRDDGTFVIACECADVTCVATMEVAGDEYRAVREIPEHFMVRPGHVYLDVERIVREGDGYTVVEKIEKAAEVAKTTA